MHVNGALYAARFARQAKQRAEEAQPQLNGQSMYNSNLGVTGLSPKTVYVCINVAPQISKLLQFMHHNTEHLTGCQEQCCPNRVVVVISHGVNPTFGCHIFIVTCCTIFGPGY